MHKNNNVLNLIRIFAAPPPESSTDSDETALGPTYSGEDIRPTSDKELRAWYAFHPNIG
jgi:hypothetical protein